MRIHLISETKGSIECPLCKRGFDRIGMGRQLYCGKCEAIVECFTCRAEFKHKVLKNAIRFNKHFCSKKCQLIYSQSLAFLICRKHGKYYGGECAKCKSKNIVVCITHGKLESSFSGQCPKCVAHNAGRKLAFVDGECNKHLLENKHALKQNIYNCWSCIKESLNLEISTNINISPDQIWQPTYRDETGKGQFMMEQRLVELSIGWFAYIKGYLKDGNWHPLVAGKTGSKIVQSGTDISFSYHGETPARMFLREENLSWDTSRVLIIPSANESEALNIEKKILSQLSLFQS